MSGFVSQDTTRAVLSGGSLARVSQDALKAILSGGSRARVSQDIQLLVIQNASAAQVAQDLELLVLLNQCAAITVTGRFFDAANNPIAGGTIEFQLNVDARMPCNGIQVAASRPVAVILDANGSIPPNTYLWANSQLTTGVAGQNTVYHIRVYNAQGLLVWQFDYATIPNVGTFDLSQLSF